MPRFFFRRKAAADDCDNVIVTPPEQHSFRVFERPGTSCASFDRPRFVPRTTPLDDDNNMFADLKINRGSGLSNTTKATSTDDSSRHSNASTAPSSAAEHEATESKCNSFLDRATRTFSFGGQKKHSIPPPSPKESCVPDLPPVLSLPGQPRSRGLTCSSGSTATPTRPDSSTINLASDFGSILTTFGGKSSPSPVNGARNDVVDARFPAGIRSASAAPATLDPAVVAGSPLSTTGSRQPSNERSSPVSRQQVSGPRCTEPENVPRQQMLGSRYPETDSPEPMTVSDRDTSLLKDSLAAIKMLSESSSQPTAQTHRYRRDEDTFVSPRSKPAAADEDNIFEGSLSRASRIPHRYAPRLSFPLNKNKVMTPAEFEKYRQDKETQGSKQRAASEAVKEEADDEDDDINYDDDDDDDEQEQSKMHARQRRKQEAHMTVYRQQMMKVTGENVIAGPPTPQRAHAPQRSPLAPSSSAPQLTSTPASPGMPWPEGPSPGIEDEDEDEDVPLGILQANGFPARLRPSTRLSHYGSNSNLRAGLPLGPPPSRPASVAGDVPPHAAMRQAALPAFARNLPPDPFVGAGMARPALRESLSFSDAGQFAQMHQMHPAPLPPGGLVGVIASEERSRALRRGSPSVDNVKLPLSMGPHAPVYDPIAGIPHHMMYGPGSMPGMMSMPPTPLTPGDQAQIQMTQQMQHFMQMQMHMMQMMAANQGAGGHPTMQPSYGGGMGDVPSRHSMAFMGDPGRTMSMAHGSSPFACPPPQDAPFAPSGPPAGYAPSIAPSERSNVGGPGRYRPVSQMQPPSSMPPMAPTHQRSATMSGGLSSWDDEKSSPTVRVVDTAGEDGSDEEDEESWPAMKALREKKRSLWKTKKHDSQLAL
ncbi:hypothetical protein CDD80_2388 [Ophiocordyceps camponoti-rufipedis]|uniref:Uncharacterized protein n=1 Tax=Ophiocordyceps camponoti-rufipedis TaxID=2004952 RepID=A0A2C5Z7Q1_9HYPO|nr:hypothetical protein CDD80_2388 [Ophiocordyceps camponoti-rufipedis]